MVILLIGGAIRLYRLGAWSCWIDELYTFERPQQPWGNNLSYPFLLLSRVSLELFGHSAFALRLFPCLFGILALLAIYALARHLFDARVAMVALLFATFSPWHIYLWQFARAYSAVILFSLRALFCLHRFAQKGPPADLALFLDLFFLGFFFHNTAAFVLVTALVFMLTAHFFPPRPQAEVAKRAALVTAVVAVLGLLFFPSFLRFAAHWREKQMASGYWGATPAGFVLRVGYHLTPSLGVAALLGMGHLLAIRRREGALLASYALIGPVALVLAAACRVNVSAKYVSCTLPAFCIAAAYFVAHLASGAQGKKVAWAGIAALVLIPSLETCYGYFTHGWGNRDRLQEAICYVHEQAAKEDVIVPLYFFKDPAEARFYVVGIAQLKGIALDSSRIYVPRQEEDLRTLPRAWVLTVGKTVPPERPHMYRWLTASSHLVAEFPALRGVQDNAVRVYFHDTQ
ncbi:MAG: glycosyltransferase family 39 protein [bacterium]|jgi:hypothetical protein|nr:glycosyltransferase family 39 protein [candidate division KSB1 bacterium]MDH7558969.1 glycosyltransferase family 39 protein [bacterium]